MASPRVAPEIERWVSESGENETIKDLYHGILLTVELKPRMYWFTTLTLATRGKFIGHDQIEYSLS